MIDIFFDQKDGFVVIETDDPDLYVYFEKRYKSYEYLPFKKQWGYTDKVMKLYNNRKTVTKNGTFLYRIRRGWVSYLMSVLENKITSTQMEYLRAEVLLSPAYRTTPFDNLRDYQNEDMLYLMKFRVGLCQVQTGYGKTSCIATLANYYRSLGKKVLLVAPSSNARDELVKRCKSVFDLEVSNCDKNLNGELDCIITSGLLNSKKAKDPSESLKFRKMLSEYQVLLADEVEYTINPGGEFIYKGCTGLEVCYGFSGTADKQAGSTISFRGGLDEVVVRNKDLIKYFGPSIIYRMPVNRTVDNIMIYSSALDDLVLPDFSDSPNIYADVMNTMWTDPKVCEVIVKIVENYPMIFIPINNLANIISCWLENYFIGRFRTLLICGKGGDKGDGYVYYDLEGNRTLLTLEGVCDYASKGLIDVIPSTSAGYRALDIPGLESILLIQGKVAGVVLQSIGRVARMSHMNIISLLPKMSSTIIPIYTKGTKARMEQLKGYYGYCDLNDLELQEEDLL